MHCMLSHVVTSLLTFLTARFMSVFGELTVEACATRGPRASKVSRLV